MKNFKNKKTLQIVLLVAIAVVTLGIGYAAISAVNLIINGNATASVDQNNFKVHFTQVQSITGSTGVSGTSNIDSQDDTKAMFDVTGLTKEGDYAEAVYTVRNDSNGIGAEITLNLTSSNTEYFRVTETILDNKLQAGEETTAKVKVEMIKTPVTDSVSTTITATLSASPLENESAVEGNLASVETIPDPVSFATDSWKTIQKAVQNNNTSVYNVGDTKEILIDVDGDGIEESYTVRIANMSKPTECNSENYSQTACGFVVEFTEVLVKKSMNDKNISDTGGWPGSELYQYIQNELFDKLPEDLKNVISRTKVISGYGYGDSSNFVSYDKLYLLSGVEVLGNDEYDKAANTTRRLDYYISSGEEVVHYEAGQSWGECDYIFPIGARKKYGSDYSRWWLRNAYYYEKTWRFIGGLSSQPSPALDFGHSYNYDNVTMEYWKGVSPAFRIG